MSYVARLALVVLVVACSRPKPPAGEEPTAPSSPSPEAPPSTAPASEPVLGAAGGVGAPSDAPVVETLFVRETLADCQAEGVRQCLQVRSSEREDWRNFFASIEGFEYQPAHAYELRVEVSPVPNAPADAPSLRYRLLEVVSKRKPGKGQTN